MSKRPKDKTEGPRTTKLGRRACHKCDLPAVEALRLDETTVHPVPLCRNHARAARRFEEREHEENRTEYWERVRRSSSHSYI